MQKSSELFEQSLLPHIYIQSQTSVFRSQLLKQRRTLIAGQILLFLLIFSTTIASACLIKLNAQHTNTLININQQISLCETQLSDKMTNQKISFGNTDNLKNLVIASFRGEGEKRIAVLDLSQSNLKSLTDNKLPNLQTLSLPPSLQVMRNNLLGMSRMQNPLPNIKIIESNIYLELQQLHLKDSPNIKILDINVFAKTKRISLINTSLSVFDANMLPALEYMEVYDNTKMEILSLVAPRLRELKMDKMNLKSLIVDQANLAEIKNFENTYSISLSHTPIESFQCPEYNRIVNIVMNNVSLTSFTLSSPTIKRINLANMSCLESIKIGISSLNPTNQFNLVIVSSKIKNISNQNNYVSQLEVFFNPELTSFTNNTMPRLITLSIHSTVQTISSNHLESLEQIRIFQIVTQTKFKGNLSIFSNNHCPNLLTIEFSFQQISQFKNNILVSISHLKLNGNNLTDSVALQVLTTNAWSSQLMQEIDMSNNSLTNASQIKRMYQEYFPNAVILV